MAVYLCVKQYRRLYVVEIMRVVGRRLEIPHQFPRVRIQRDDRTRPEVRALPALPRHYWIRIPRAPIQEIELGIVCSCQPGHAAAMRHRLRAGPRLRSRLARLWFRIPSPLQRASFWIASLQKSRNVQRVSANTDDQVSPYNER